jgi:hypothetical protein
MARPAVYLRSDETFCVSICGVMSNEQNTEVLSEKSVSLPVCARKIVFEPLWD